MPHSRSREKRGKWPTSRCSPSGRHGSTLCSSRQSVWLSPSHSTPCSCSSHHPAAQSAHWTGGLGPPACLRVNKRRELTHDHTILQEKSLHNMIVCGNVCCDKISTAVHRKNVEKALGVRKVCRENRVRKGSLYNTYCCVSLFDSLILSAWQFFGL